MDTQAMRRASEAALERIGPYLRPTALERSPALSARAGGEVWLKLECHQDTGSFKLRGALNKVLSLSDDARRRGVVAASTGNHGLAVARACGRFGVEAEVLVPENAAPTKVKALREAGVRVRVAGATCDAAEAIGRADAERTGRTFVSPYNDPAVVAGQGTLGLEIEAELGGAPDVTVVALGCGGLAAGVAAALKANAPASRLLAASPENDCAMAASIRAGRIVDVPARPTLSDGTAGGVEPGSVTFAMCQALVDEVVLLPEPEIRAALRWVIDAHHVLVEGAAAVAVAAALRGGASLAGKRAVVVLCGANIGAAELARALA